MIVIRSAHELLDAFRPLDLRIFELPDERMYPLPVAGYTAWVEHGGARVYLLFEEPASGEARGIVFHRSDAGSGRTQMCDFCHFFGTNDEVGLLVADVTRRRRVGVYVCRDLCCAERIEEEANRRGRGTEEARRRLLERIARFGREALGIEPE